MIEREKKLLLTQDEYDYLMEHLGYESPLIQKPITTQINYYFDTDDLSMNRQNTTCRIRFKDGKYKATMKKHSTDSEQSTETEIAIYNGLDSNAFIDMGLKLHGKLITKRCVVLKDANYKVVLDKNEYLGHTDYELEIEYALGHEKDAKSIYRYIVETLQRNCPLITYSTAIISSKSARFFEVYATKERR